MLGYTGDRRAARTSRNSVIFCGGSKGSPCTFLRRQGEGTEFPSSLAITNYAETRLPTTLVELRRTSRGTSPWQASPCVRYSGGILFPERKEGSSRSPVVSNQPLVALAPGGRWSTLVVWTTEQGLCVSGGLTSRARSLTY